MKIGDKVKLKISLYTLKKGHLGVIKSSVFNDMSTGYYYRVKVNQHEYYLYETDLELCKEEIKTLWDI